MRAMSVMLTCLLLNANGMKLKQFFSRESGDTLAIVVASTSTL